MGRVSVSRETRLQLIELRTRRDKLVGRLEPASLQLYVRWRGEEAVFDLAELARRHGIVVRILEPGNGDEK